MEEKYVGDVTFVIRLWSISWASYEMKQEFSNGEKMPVLLNEISKHLPYLPVVFLYIQLGQQALLYDDCTCQWACTLV